LQALSSIQSGTAADTTGDGTALLARVMTDVAGSVRSVVTSLNALAGVLPDLISLAVRHARRYLQAALRDVTDSLGASSGSLDTITAQLAGMIGSMPGDGPMVSTPEGGSANPLGKSSGDGVLTDVSDTLSTVANLLSALAGSLSSVLAGASGPNSSAAGARQVIDMIFSGVA